MNFDIMHTPSLVTRDQGQHHAQTTPAIAAELLRTKQRQAPKDSTADST